MPESPVQTARVSEIPPLSESDPGEPEWRPVRHHFGIASFGVNAWIARKDGDLVIEEHTETEGGAAGHEELYFVVSGKARFTVGDETVEAPAGTFVYVRDPQVKRAAVADGAGTTVLAMGAKPGIAFQPSPWELKHVER